MTIIHTRYEGKTRECWRDVQNWPTKELRNNFTIVWCDGELYVMVNCMCQLGWIMMPRYMVKQDSVCVGAFACMPAKSLQSCPTLWNPMDCNLPGFSFHGILQARILERVTMLSSRGSSQSRDQIHISSTSYIDRQVLYHRVLLDKIDLWWI